ncbi:TIM44-like domain-containing protein [Conexibacter sp. DBS9H8]|uniref:TIM44-like domain-containing protein n=1 Tax=Conexibacter sp. DBS9H8 TaxID=2937801 RepID=UPI00200E55F6|nr:TIM44-like domain-containing protein [Conexibacter sp. DBS9H8]
MPRRRLVLLLLVAGVLVMALLPAVALARGGSGVGGFSLGGEGGGSGGGAGKGFIIYIALRLLIDLVLFGHGVGALIAVGLVLAAWIYFYGGRWIGDWFTAQRRRGPAQRREARRRERRVALAAAEAADADGAFDPERVRAAAQELFVDVQSAWDRGDVATLRTLIAPRLLGEWERRLDELSRRGLCNHVELTGPPKVQFVGIGVGARATGPGEGPDRVVVRIDARLRDWIVDARGREHNERGAATKTVRMREYWTLVRTPVNPAGSGPADPQASLDAEFDLSLHSNSGPAREWMLASIEQGAEGAYQLEAKLVQTGWADADALRDQALVEQAQAEAAPLGSDLSLGELTDTTVAIETDARARALDLSLADGRFAPDVLEVAARRAVAAWAQAIDGETRPLLSLASPAASDEMLHPAGPRSRLVVRGPRIERITVVSLDAKATPPIMAVDVKITGRRYLQDRATASIVAGSDIHAVTFTERWTFSLSDAPDNPWQISAVTSPALAR